MSTETTATTITLQIEGQEHTLDLAKLTFAEGEAIERSIGGTIKDFGQALINGSLSAQKILVWTVLRRSKPSLRLGDLDSMPVDAVVVVDTAKKAAGGPAQKDRPTGAAPAARRSRSASAA